MAHILDTVDSTMANDILKQQVDAIDASLRGLGSYAATAKALENSFGARYLLEEARRCDELLRTIYDPIEEIRRACGTDLAAVLADQMKPMHSVVDEIQVRFRLPDAVEAVQLIKEMEASSATSVRKLYEDQALGLQRAMEAMQSPWLDIEDSLRSISSFAELQRIGDALLTFPTFDDELSRLLRDGLGDWRSVISWPENIFVDSLARSTFYAERGFDPALTAFPSDAFEESISVASIKRIPPPFANAYSNEPSEDSGNEEAGFERTNAAHDRLLRFETQVRRFIDERMTDGFGENWTKHQVPEDIRRAWSEKQQKAKDNGEREWPLIAYADFTDYLPIITRKDNWERVFKPHFQRAEFVRESFQRLYPIRICTMHARLITQDDELYLFVETMRILKVMGVQV